ncbi:coiled-coil domain-containing protein, putative [Babesia ovis]|uniref:Coiled-coil domain-containing protein, putative n=1 Tax=Babesia ovis TaxID=5869 RepID=A0A9W5TEC1_BABOV|nr:coiled-coil domain-containing protein, putative [Babesia ovis]
MRPDRADYEDIFAEAKWQESFLETRGNGLFVFDPEVCNGPSSPNMAWILEHVRLEVHPVTAEMTLPTVADRSTSKAGAVIYFFENRGDTEAFLAIYYPHMEAAKLDCAQLRLCSLTYMRSLVNNTVEDLSAGEVAHTIESLIYSRETLVQQKDMLRLDNTLLQSQYATNKQVFSESTAMQIHENAALRSQLERCMDRIATLEGDAQARESTINGLKEANEQLSTLASRLESQIETSRSLRALSSHSSDDLLFRDYEAKLADMEHLSKEIDALRKDNARITNQYHNYKSEVNREYDRVEELLYHGTIYEMLMHWISCNDLKVEYYETCHRMNPQEHQAFCERIQTAQEEFRTSITLARASYINCRTHLFNELLTSMHGHKLELPRSKRLLTLALERLDWIFQPESSHFDAKEPVWMNQSNFHDLLENLLYKTSDYVWYNKLSYVAALKPILTNDAASESLMLKLKRQLHESLSQNLSLKQQVASLQKMTGKSGILGIWRKCLLECRLVERLAQPLGAIWVQISNTGIKLVTVLDNRAQVDAVQRKGKVPEVGLNAQNVSHDLCRGASQRGGEVVEVLEPRPLEEALEQSDARGVQHRLFLVVRDAGEVSLKVRPCGR